jgi:hypothetical protein
MSRGIGTFVRVVLASITVLAAVALSASPGKASGLQGQAAHGTALTQALDYHEDDEGQPCHGRGILLSPGCCTLAHASGAAIASPQNTVAVSLSGAERTEYSALEAPPTKGVPVTPTSPPPRAMVRAATGTAASVG